MKKICICGNPDCDSPFHKGDVVEVQWGDGWIRGKVVAEVRTRVTVKFLTPILYTEKRTTVTKTLFGKKTLSEQWKDKILKTMTFGASYVRFPETKSWERP